MTGKGVSILSGLLTAAIIFSAAPQVHAFDFFGPDESSESNLEQDVQNMDEQEQDVQKMDEQESGPPEITGTRDLSGVRIGYIGQFLSTDDLPQVVVINEDMGKSDSSARQPRLKHLQIQDLKLGNDKKTIEFSINNTFNRKHAKPVRIGGVLVSGQVRYDYDKGKAVHNAVLFKETRLVLQNGPNEFTTNPKDYPHVTDIEKLQFFYLPAKIGRSTYEDTSKYADISQPFDVNNLPPVVVVDRATIEQNAEKGDPRLGFIRINNINCNQERNIVDFSVENVFNRMDAEPIHVGNLLVTAMARFDFDGGKELHSCILYDDKHVVLAKGSTHFQSTPELYPGVAKIESIQFVMTP